VRLVFTDVNMPGSMNGLRLAHAVRGRWPPVELLVTSALGNITAQDLPERGRFLAKPYDNVTLSEAFQQMAGD
jgi:CheY-like chemotaxis protein